MRAKVSKKDILPAVVRGAGIVDRKSVMPILSHILLDFNKDGLTVRATDLDHSIIEKIPARVDTFGTIAVPAGVFCDILRKADDSADLEFSLIDKGEKLQLTAGRSKYELSTLNAQDFPVIPTVDNSCRFTFKCELFNKLISRTKFSISPEENRHTLNGIYLHREDDMLRAASTDGHRLSVSAIPIDAKESIQGVIVSRKTIVEIKKLLDVMEGDITITFSQNLIQFELGNVVFISKLVDGNFPDYKRVIPPTDASDFFTVKRSDFVSVVDRVSVISEDKSRAIKLELNKNTLCCYVVNNKLGSGKDEVDVSYSGEGWAAGFNSGYLLDVAQTLEGDQLKIFVKEALSPILITDESEPESLFVIMPMRI